LETNPSLQPQSSETQPNAVSAPPSPPQLGVTDYRFRAEDGVETWMIGRTASEVAQIAGRTVRDVMNAMPQTPPQPPQATQSRAQNGEPDPELLITNPEEYHRQSQAYNRASVDAQVAAYAAPFTQSTSELARDASARDTRWTDVWRRFGPEIDALVATNTVQNPVARTQKSLWDQAAEIVQGRHYRELAAEEVERQRAQPAPSSTVRPSDNGYAPNYTVTSTDGLDELFASNDAWAVSAREADMNPTMIREYCAKRNIPVETYIKQIKQSGFTRDGRGRFSNPVGSQFADNVRR